MTRFAVPAPEESISLHLVPLLDVMFLLLLFVMTGSDYSHREPSEVRLPAARMAGSYG